MAGRKETIGRKRGEVTLRCKPGLRWSVESKGICLFDPERSEALTLTYPEVAVWGLVQRGYAIEKTVELLGAITLEDEKTARTLLMRTLQGWIEKGVLCIEENHG